MIKALKDFPDNVIAIACHGRVTRADYETVLVPDIEDKLSRHKKVRIYCEIAPDYGKRTHPAPITTNVSHSARSCGSVAISNLDRIASRR